MVNEKQNFLYDEKVSSILMETQPPSFKMVFDWMKHSSGRAISFDIWARGNYLRWVINNQKESLTPLIVPIRNQNEMRWAYRRLALFSLPVEFLYIGGVTKPQKILHLYPADGIINEGGWGYIGALGDIIKIRGRKWFPVIGYSQLMPESLLDWLIEETGDAFLKGNIFITPAELVGIDPFEPTRGMKALADIENGGPIDQSANACKTLMQFELPFLDNMSPSAFHKFIADHDDELIRFRAAFKKLVAGVPEKDINILLEELRNEIAEIRLSDHHTSMRKTITMLGGTISTFSATIVAYATAAPEIALPVAATVGAAAATTMLTELWKQYNEREEKKITNPYFIIWKLGVDKPSKIHLRRENIEFKRYERLEEWEPGSLADFHWLCPPKPGLRFLAVKK